MTGPALAGLLAAVVQIPVGPGRADLPAPPDRVVFDAGRHAVVISTGVRLFLAPVPSPAAENERLVRVDLRGAGPRVARLKPAPGGGVVLAIEGSHGRVGRMTVHDLSGARLGVIAPPRGSPPFRTVLLAHRGRAIATESDRIEPPAGENRWEWTLWGPRGHRLGGFSLADRPLSAFDPSGEVLVLFFPDRAEIRTLEGKVRRTIRGSFARGAVSVRARTLLLAHGDDPRTLTILQDDRVRRVRASETIVRVALSPHGTAGAVWLADGTIQPVRPRAGTLDPPVALPGPDRRVSALEVEDGGRILVGLTDRKGRNGAVALVENTQVILETCFPADGPADPGPRLLAPAEGSLPVWNLDRLSLIELRGARSTPCS